jgi:REP element-mobilizing transposase RayT
MPRAQTPLISPFPFHITSRCPNRVAFPLPLNEVWDIFERQLFFVHHVYGLKIHQFVLMPNHFHLVATSNEVPLGQAMKYLLREASKEINDQAARINQNFGGRYYKTIVGNPHYALNVYKYVYQNPVRAGLARYCEEWPWSTLHRILGFKHLLIPLEPDTILFAPDFIDEALAWLNRSPEQKSVDEMRRYLKKGIMRPFTDQKTGRVSDLENHLI